MHAHIQAKKLSEHISLSWITARQKTAASIGTVINNIFVAGPRRANIHTALFDRRSLLAELAERLSYPQRRADYPVGHRRSWCGILRNESIPLGTPTHVPNYAIKRVDTLELRNAHF